MQRKNLIQLPDNINPGGLLTIKAASEISGIPESTIRGYRCQPGNGLKFYKKGNPNKEEEKKKTRIYLKCDEFVAWVNLVFVEAEVRKFTFTSDSISRGRDAPGTSYVKSFVGPVSRLIPPVGERR